MRHRGLVAWLTTIAACTTTPGTLGPPPEPTLIAHRGASVLAPEHTLAAYDLAIEIGADYLEHDLQLTFDGVLVVLHDDTLDRTARGPAENCSGAVAEKTLAQLETCDFGTWFTERDPAAGNRFAGQRIVSLDALLARYGTSVRYYIETKQPEEAPGMEEALVSLLAAYNLLPTSSRDRSVVVQSFSTASLRKLHALRPELPLVRLFDEGELGTAVDVVFAELSKIAVGIGPNHADVDEDLVASAHRHGLVVHPWTVNTRADMHRVLEFGVDGVFTDDSELFVEVRADRLRALGYID